MRFFGPKSLKTPTYMCEKSSCIKRRADAVDFLVYETLMKRLERKDAMKLFVKAGDDAMTEAHTEADTLHKRLQGFIDQASDGKLSPASLAKIEAKLLPQIDAAEAKGRTAVMSPLVAKLAGPDARKRWKSFSVKDRRTVAGSLLNVTIKKIEHGTTRRFDPLDVDVTWKNAV